MDELLYRQMPHSLEAEQAVLGSMLIDANCIKDVMEKLRPEDFYLRQNREIFETIYSMFLYSKPIDGVTVAGEMERNGTYDENTTRNYLVQLMEVTPTSANVNEYADIVRDKALLRAIATVASDITGMVQDGTGGASAVLDAAEQKIYAVRRGRSAQNMEQISVVLQGVLDHLAELSATGGKTLPGLSTGLSAVDDKINGLSKSDLILLAARPGMGKTSFALNVALNVAKASGKAVAVFSLEMSKEQLVTRVLSNEALVENGRLISGNLRESDWVKIAEAASTPHGHQDRRQSAPHRRGHECQMPPHRKPRPRCHRLSSADDLRRREGLQRRKPPAGGERHFTYAQDHGEGIAGPCALPFTALARERKARRQAPHALRPA